MNNAVTAIEPGTTKMVVLIGRRNRDGMLELSGLGNVGFDGVRGDRWQDSGTISRVLDEALGQAQKMAGFRISHCTLGIPNEFCGLVRNTGEIATGRKVTKQDVLELRKMASSYSLPPPWKISDVLYGNFRMDDRIVGNPLGMPCERLALEASLICIHHDFTRQAIRILSSRKIGVDRILPVPLACGETFLTREEKQNGAVWIDVGGHSTDIAVYRKGIPVFWDWLPVGGDTITQDIVAGTGVSPAEAERLKKVCVLGLALNGESEDSSLDLPVHSSRSVHSVPLAFLQEIVEARVEELLEIIRDRITAEDRMDECRTVVLAGGGISLLRGIREFASRVLGLPIRLGVPDVIGLSSPTLSAVYSLGCGSPDGTAGARDILRALLRKTKAMF